MKTIIKSIFLILLGIIFSCSASKRLYEKGLKLESEGMYKEASNFYYESLKKDIKNIDAAIALKKVGFRIYQDYMDELSEANKREFHKDAVYAYLNAEEFRQKLSSVNVNISKDKVGEMNYKESKEKYSEILIEKSNNLLAEEKFKEAEVHLNELVKLNPENQNIQEMRAMAYSEPIYREGLKNMESDQNRKAYYNFSKITNYKDSKELQKLSQEKATFKIAIIPIVNNTPNKNVSNKLYGYIFKDILNKKNPFLQLLDQKQVRSILSDKGINIESFNNNNQKFLNTMAQVFGVNAFLRSEVTSVDYNKEELKPRDRFAYNRFVKTITSEGKKKELVRYQKATYKEYNASNSIYISFNFSLISKEGQILISDAISKKTSSSVHYANYKGDYRKLYPQYKGQPSIDKAMRKELHSLFSANRRLRSNIELENENVIYLSRKLANKVISYNPEK